MIIDIPPNEPCQAVQGKNSYMCWIRSPTTPETNQTISFCINEAENHPGKFFINIRHGFHGDFCKSRKITYIGDVSRVKNNRVVFHESSPDKATVLRQIRLMDETGTERNEDIDDLERPSTSSAVNPVRRVSVTESLPRRSISSFGERFSAVPQPMRTFAPVMNRPFESLPPIVQRCEAQIQTLTRRSSFSRGSRDRSRSRERRNSVSEPSVSRRPVTASTSNGAPFGRPDNKDLGARPKCFRK